MDREAPRGEGLLVGAGGFEPPKLILGNRAPSENVSTRCHDASMPTEKRCPRCGITKAASEFGVRTANSNVLRTYCRPCSRKVWRVWYSRERNRQKHLAQVAARRRKRIERHRKLLQDVKSQPCADCGGRFPYYVMDFDHLGDKVAEVSLMAPSYGTESLLAEVAKCDVVCANCHRIRTFRRLRTQGKASMRRGTRSPKDQSRLPGLA